MGNACGCGPKPPVGLAEKSKSTHTETSIKVLPSGEDDDVVEQPQISSGHHDECVSTAPDDPLPDGWERVASRSRPGEFTYLNTITGKRVRQRPTEEPVRAMASTDNDEPPLPDGWRRFPSRSQPGEFIYRNMITGQRVRQRPTEPAAALASTFRRTVEAAPEVGAMSVAPQVDEQKQQPERHNSVDHTLLVNLFEETHGEDWNIKKNWNSVENLDQWHGVATNADGRVTELHLHANKLLGTCVWRHTLAVA